MLRQWGVGPPPCPMQDGGLGLETSPGGEACPNLAVCSLGRQRACLCWWAACSFCSPREMGVLSASPGRDLVAPLRKPFWITAMEPHAGFLSTWLTSGPWEHLCICIQTNPGGHVPPPSPWSSHFPWRGCRKLLDSPGGPHCARAGRGQSKLVERTAETKFRCLPL